MSARGPWRGLAALLMLVAGVTMAVWALGFSDVAQIQAWVAKAGPAGPLIFAAVFALVTLAPLPKNAFSAVAGLLFGLWIGVAAVLAGATAGAVLAFALARLLGREAVEKWTGRRIGRIDELLRRQGFLGILFLRLVPVLPFTAINYGSGLTAVRFLPYLLATIVGMVPGTVAYVALGTYGQRPGSWEFVTAIGVLAALSVGGLLWARWSRAPADRVQEEAAPDPLP